MTVWIALLAYMIPAAVTVYGMIVVLTGEVAGFATRTAHGRVARILGMVLIAALPLSIVFGPVLPIRSVSWNQEYVTRAREIEQDYREYFDWRKQTKENQPGLDLSLHLTEVESRLRELTEKQIRLRQDQEIRHRQEHAAAGRRGALWVGLAVLWSVWALAWMAGYPTAINDPLSTGWS
jgi:hypothetical protein